MFCASAAYPERKVFYTTMFGVPWEGSINEGSEGHRYRGSIWDKQDGLVFALLINPALSDRTEQLAHFGFIFDSALEFDAEIRRRSIDAAQIKVLPGGQRQVFVRGENIPGVEWEFSCSEAVKP